MTTLQERTTTSGGAAGRPVLAAAAHLLALGTGLAVYSGIDGWRPGISEHDRATLAVLAALAAGALLTGLASLAVPRPLRAGWLTFVGIGLVPSFAAAGLATLLAAAPLPDDAVRSGLALAVVAVVGALAGSDRLTRRATEPVGIAVLATLALPSAFLLWAGTSLWQ